MFPSSFCGSKVDFVPQEILQNSTQKGPMAKYQMYLAVGPMLFCVLVLSHITV